MNGCQEILCYMPLYLNLFDHYTGTLKALCHALRANCLLIEAARANVVNEKMGMVDG